MRLLARRRRRLGDVRRVEDDELRAAALTAYQERVVAELPPVSRRSASFAGRVARCSLPVVASYGLVSRKRYQPWPGAVHGSWLPRIMTQGAAASSGAPGLKKSACQASQP